MPRELTMSGIETTEWKKGVVVSGRYINCKKLANADSLLHYFENPKGRSAVWGTTVLDGTLVDVKAPDDYVVIRCEGTLTARKGSAEYWGFRVVTLLPDEVKAFEAGKLTADQIFKGPPAGTDKPPKSRGN